MVVLTLCMLSTSQTSYIRPDSKFWPLSDNNSVGTPCRQTILSTSNRAIVSRFSGVGLHPLCKIVHVDYHELVSIFRQWHLHNVNPNHFECPRNRNGLQWGSVQMTSTTVGGTGEASTAVMMYISIHPIPPIPPS